MREVKVYFSLDGDPFGEADFDRLSIKDPFIERTRQEGETDDDFRSWFHRGKVSVVDVPGVVTDSLVALLVGSHFQPDDCGTVPWLILARSELYALRSRIREGR